MRLIHLILAVFMAAVGLAVARDEAGRVALIVFFTGLAEVIFGTIGLMSLFQTVGAIGEADGPLAYASAIASTALVLVVATATMNGVLWLGLGLLQWAVP